MQALSVSVRPSMLQEDIRLGKKLASGGFGTVFRGDLLDIYPEPELPVVVKKVPPCLQCRHMI
jgi:hypothetical protein